MLAEASKRYRRICAITSRRLMCVDMTRFVKKQTPSQNFVVKFCKSNISFDAA